MKQDDTFVKITNADVYRKIETLENKVDIFIHRIEAQEQRVDTLVKAVWILFTVAVGGVMTVAMKILGLPK